MTTPKNDHAGILQVIHALKKAGWNPTEITDPELVDVSTLNGNEIADLIVKNYDSTVLRFKKPEAANSRIQWVYFVLGNSPDEVVCDYTVGNKEFDTIVSEITGNW